MHVIEGGAQVVMDAADMLADAERRLARAEELRAAADREETAAWGLKARAAVAQLAGGTTRARRRPRIEGDPAMSRNRVIALMEALCIDEHVSPRDGLDLPLSLVERRMGVCYARRGVPPVGVRIANCEAALRHDITLFAA